MSRTPLLLKAAALAAPVPAVMIALSAGAAGVGWISYDLSLRVLTLTVGWGLAWACLALGMTALAIWLRDGLRARTWGGPMRALLVLLGVAGPLAVVATFHLVRTRAYDLPPIHETATDWSRPLGAPATRPRGAWPMQADPRVPADIGEVHRAWAPWAGRRVAEINAETCPAARTIPRLVSSREVAAALKAEGVVVLGEGPWRVDGVQSSVWFGRRRDVVVRMEPAATDIRVSERVGLGDFGDTCRLASALVGRLDAQAGR